jgi:hypothetical protein
VILDTDGLYRKIRGKNEEKLRSTLDPYAGRRYYALKLGIPFFPRLPQSRHHAVLASRKQQSSIPCSLMSVNFPQCLRRSPKSRRRSAPMRKSTIH